MAKLRILIDEKNGKTQSKFARNKNLDTIVFVNKHQSETLKVTIKGEEGAGAVLCQGAQDFPEFTVTVVEQKKEFTICKNYLGEEFKYTAKLGGLPEEDPIIIIERFRADDFYAIALLVVGAAAVAFVAGTLLGMRRARRGMAAPA